MLTQEKRSATFVIRGNLVRVTFHQSVLRVQQTNLSQGNEIYFCEVGEVGVGYRHLFNSACHIYNYLTTRPQCIIQITQKLFKFVVSVNGSTHICCIDMHLLQKREEDLWIRRKCLTISVNKHEARFEQERLQSQCQQLSKKARQSGDILKMQRQRLQQAEQIQRKLQIELNEKRQERAQLQLLLRRKEGTLKEIKTKEGAFVSLDD